MAEMSLEEAMGIASWVADYPPAEDDESIAARQAKVTITLFREVVRLKSSIDIDRDAALAEVERLSADLERLGR